ncbi:hypothetical protein LCGC14_1062270 [marine sediment metagenome]|uniref:Uncharacterized protein n=1 Tax=marine sediment metagenome TaxID=412755 RepID=A0A0F9N7R6_9ZZZZ
MYQHEYNAALATAILQNLSDEDIMLVMHRRNVDSDPKLDAFIPMLMGLKETCQIHLTDYTRK